MPPHRLPDDPFLLVEPAPRPPADRRTLTVHGAPVELLLVPERRDRAGVPTPERPPFRASMVERILREETVCEGPGWAVTPNRYPLAERELLVWATDPVRELPESLLGLAFDLEERTGCTILANVVGSAASIPRAHFHAVPDRLPFLGALRKEPWLPADLAGVDELSSADVQLCRLSQPYPILAVGVAGTTSAARARAVHWLLRERLAPAFNLIASEGTAWVVPRIGPEVPDEFGYALGAAELWGRWFFPEETPFHTATSADLEGALARVGSRV